MWFGQQRHRQLRVKPKLWNSRCDFSGHTKEWIRRQGLGPCLFRKWSPRTTEILDITAWTESVSCRQDTTVLFIHRSRAIRRGLEFLVLFCKAASSQLAWHVFLGNGWGQLLSSGSDTVIMNVLYVAAFLRLLGLFFLLRCDRTSFFELLPSWRHFLGVVRVVLPQVFPLC